MRAYQPAVGGPLQFNPPNPNQRATTYQALNVPCGTCILCRNETARQWAVRIAHEAQQWEENSFITLTYSDENLPQHGSLDYQDLVKFWKRLRKETGSLRYYAVGEYGDKTQRPHYHACLFGHDFISGGIQTRDVPNKLWVNPMLDRCWGLGQVSVGKLNFETARYTASYVTKKLRQKQQYVRIEEKTGELIPLVQPRAFMSKNIGRDWWDAWKQGVIDHDRVIINAHPQKPPKAYDRWLLKENQQKMKEIKAIRKEKAQTLDQDQSRARARNAHAHAKNKSKSV